MSARVLDGRPVARRVREGVAARVRALRGKGVVPCLAAVLVGDDPASQVYVGRKEQACRQVGIDSRVLRLPKETTMEELRRILAALAADPAVHGVLVQQPLPPQCDLAEVAMAVPPEKDVDGLHPYNAGRLLRGERGLLPCTPRGIMTLLRHYDIPVAGRSAVIVGRSMLVGRPLAALLLHADATVTLCHSRTPDLAHWTRQADILVVAVGRPGLIQPAMVRPGAAVVDVGITRCGDRLLGDVDPSVADVAGALSPVPGGVGPMTVAMLLENTVEAAEWSISKPKQP